MDTAEDVKISTPTDREVVVTRTFDAPRTLVFDAYTQPELLKRWYDAPGRSLVVCEIDLRVGGAYRFLWRGEGRKDVGMRGVHREVVRPERLVRTETWEDWDAGEIIETVRVHRASRQDDADFDRTVSVPRRARCRAEGGPRERNTGNVWPAGRRAKELAALEGRCIGTNAPCPRPMRKRWHSPRNRSRMSHPGLTTRKRLGVT